MHQDLFLNSHSYIMWKYACRVRDLPGQLLVEIWEKDDQTIFLIKELMDEMDFDNRKIEVELSDGDL